LSDSESNFAAVHRGVLIAEVIDRLEPKPGAIVLDGTAGAGGHTAALARRVAPEGRVIALDRDPEMLELARKATEGLNIDFVRASYDDARSVLAERGIEHVDAAILDLGLSSDQLAWAHRGFSFQHEGPLDMRFDPDRQRESAADLVNRLDAESLADLFYHYGEERFSRRIARRIVEIRKSERIETTSRLAEIVRKSIPGKRGPIDPATRVFQALRIAVNDELERLRAFLTEATEFIKPGGRLAIISFHSLEDRIVKHAFRDDPLWSPLTRKPITAEDQERAENPRSRSAKMRVAERCLNTKQIRPKD
jgi:16S rRNA (cytosine1402-N4)-methyltransferase